MDNQKREREKKRQESRRRAVRRDVITAVALLLVAVIIVTLIVSCAARSSGSQTEEENTTTSSSLQETDATSSTETTSSSEPTTTTTEEPTTTTTTTTQAPTTTTTTTKATTKATTQATVVSSDGHYVQKDKSVWYLLLVNNWNGISEDYVSGIPLTDTGSGVQNSRFDTRAVDALQKMINACRSEGCSIWAQSMFRPYDTQSVLYDREVAYMESLGYTGQEAEDRAAMVVARPGRSEHNTGLAVDFNNCSTDFKDTSAYAWLMKHCAEYGFILRFPSGKESVTGVEYEPWHFRYVGVDAAEEIMSAGITLEEYCENHQL